MLLKLFYSNEVNILNDFNTILIEKELPTLATNSITAVKESMIMKDVISKKLTSIGNIKDRELNIKHLAEDIETLKNTLQKTNDEYKMKHIQDILFSYKLKYNIRIDSFDNIALLIQAIDQRYNLAGLAVEFVEILKIYEIYDVAHEVKTLYNIDELKCFEKYLLELQKLVSIDTKLEDFISYKLSDLEILVFNIKRSSDYRLRRSQKGVYR